MSFLARNIIICSHNYGNKLIRYVFTVESVCNQTIKKQNSNFIPAFPQEDLIMSHAYFNNTPFVMSNFDESSAEDKHCLTFLGTILEQMTSACAGGYESEGLLREGDNVIIGVGDCELEIGGDVIDGVGVSRTTSEKALGKIERPGVRKEGLSLIHI